MAVFIRAKRVTDPLDDKAKARLCCPDHHRHSTSSSNSSGSDHDAPCSLSSLVHAFLESSTDPNHSDEVSSTTDYDDSTESPSSLVLPQEAIHDLLCPPTTEDSFRARLLADASAATQALSGFLRPTGSACLRAVMARLRSAGYNAGICKSRWEATGNLTAGNYEFIDVVAPPSGRRYIVEVDFAAGFEIARAAPEYQRILAALPGVAVATAEEMTRAVRALADAIGRSFRSQGLTVPPWRKSQYMLTKWLGPYRRTVSPIPASTGGAAASSGGGEVKCRAVGFHAAATGMTVRPGARTRYTGGSKYAADDREKRSPMTWSVSGARLVDI